MIAFNLYSSLIIALELQLFMNQVRLTEAKQDQQLKQNVLCKTFYLLCK